MYQQSVGQKKKRVCAFESTFTFLLISLLFFWIQWNDKWNAFWDN